MYTTNTTTVGVVRKIHTRTHKRTYISTPPPPNQTPTYTNAIAHGFAHQSINRAIGGFVTANGDNPHGRVVIGEIIGKTWPTTDCT